MRKIWCSFCIFLFGMLASGCQRAPVPLQEKNQELLNSANQIIETLNSAFSLEDSAYSGTLSLTSSSPSKTLQLGLTGNYSMLGGDAEGEVNLGVQQTWTEIGTQLFLSLRSKIRKKATRYFFFPEHLSFSQGEGHIQSRFLQLMFNGLLGKRSRIDPKFSQNNNFFSGRVQLPQLFSGTAFQSWTFSDFFTWRVPELQFLSGTAEATPEGIWQFHSLTFRYKDQIFPFSGSFDGEHFVGRIPSFQGNTLQRTLTKEKDQLFLSWERGVMNLEANLKVLSPHHYSLRLTLWKTTNPNEKIELKTYFSRFPQISPLQSAPNSYIFLEKYLEDLNISF